MKDIFKEVWKWLTLAALLVLVAVASAWSERSGYSRGEVDGMIDTVRAIHEKDMANQQKQLDRIDNNVQALVDRWLDEGVNK